MNWQSLMAETRAKEAVSQANNALFSGDPDFYSSPKSIMTSTQLIAEAEKRFEELAEKRFDYRSFYNGYLEGRTQQIDKALAAKTLIQDMLSVFTEDGRQVLVTDERVEVWKAELQKL